MCVFLVRSLGGVAYSGHASGRGAPPGRANGRPVHHRNDAFVLDIRLPAGLEPFRLERKRDVYREHGGGRPMRFVESIEPAGEAETVCIQVAAADSLYVTDDFLVTHNTLNDTFIILDEAQNTSPEQIKMFLTRLGFNSKMVVTGDMTQIDLPQGPALRPARDRGHPRGGRGDRVRALRRARTWCGTSSCSASSPPTTSTRRAGRAGTSQARRQQG